MVRKIGIVMAGILLLLFLFSFIRFGWIGGMIVIIIYILVGAIALYESFLLPMTNPANPRIASPFLYDTITALLPGHDVESLSSIVDRVGIRGGMRVLEIGSGTGWFSIRIAQIMDLRIDGVDVCEKMLKRAREKAVRSGAEVNFHLGSAENLEFRDSTFDVVCAIYCMNVVHDKDVALGEMVRVTKPSGKVAIYVPKPLFSHMLDGKIYAEKMCDLGLKDVRVDEINLTSLLIHGRK